MGKIAVLFSGQGAQKAGMGRDLYDNSPAARAVFDMAEAIRPGTVEQCFEGSDEVLARTINTQPCLFCVDLAAAQALREAGVRADMLAGFSLGELAAIAYSGAMTQEDAFRLVIKRAELMQKASETVDAGMLAVLKLADEDVIALCAEMTGAYPVNFNCEGQVVVACRSDGMEELKVLVKARGGRGLPLKVGGGFHSPFMDSAAEGFKDALADFEIGTPGLPLYSNVTAEPYEGDARELLSRQMKSPVMWRKTILNMISRGADTFIEAGPGGTLTGLVSRISGDVRAVSVEDMSGLREVAHS